MGMVIEGEWIDDDAKYHNPTGGAFVRAESKFRDFVTADGCRVITLFPAEELPIANPY